jgi:hypothetical protein
MRPADDLAEEMEDEANRELRRLLRAVRWVVSVSSRGFRRLPPQEMTDLLDVIRYSTDIPALSELTENLDAIGGCEPFIEMIRSRLADARRPSSGPVAPSDTGWSSRLGADRVG